VTKPRSIRPKVRFEVFKRDKFTCQYCGRSAPDVILELEHITPVSAGGDSDIMNLITSCKECNAGKGMRALTDGAAMKKRKKQLDELQERREQLSAMMKWQQELLRMDDDASEFLQALWKELAPGYHLNEQGVTTLRKMMRKFDLAELSAAMRQSATQYLVIKDGALTQESVQKAFEYVFRIANCTNLCQQEPYMRDLFYIRGIMRHRYAYVNEWEALGLLKGAYHAGHDTDELKQLVFDSRNWTEWRERITVLGGKNNEQA